MEGNDEIVMNRKNGKKTLAPLEGGARQRDWYLDFLRGLCAVSIVVIHTAFWSGTAYVPTEMQSITLLFDVPFFFFLAGWSFSYTQNPAKVYKNLLVMQMKYLFFLVIYSIILLLANRPDFSVSNFVHWFFYFDPQPTKVLPVVMGSIWFMPVFIQVAMLYSLAIHFTQLNRKTIVVLLVSLFGFLYTQTGGGFFFFPREILFYGTFYTLGFLSVRYVITSKRKLFVSLSALILLIMILGKFFHIDISNLQNLKFPPHFLYMLASLITIVLAMYFKSFVKIKPTNFIVHIGQNALFYYFSQGIATSISYYYVDIFHMQWAVKFFLIVILNILTAVLIAETIIFLYRNLESFCKNHIAAKWKLSFHGLRILSERE